MMLALQVAKVGMIGLLFVAGWIVTTNAWHAMKARRPWSMVFSGVLGPAVIWLALSLCRY